MIFGNLSLLYQNIQFIQLLELIYTNKVYLIHYNNRCLYWIYNYDAALTINPTSCISFTRL